MARVQVALRIRPMSAAELAEGARPIAHRLDEQGSSEGAALRYRKSQNLRRNGSGWELGTPRGAVPRRDRDTQGLCGVSASPAVGTLACCAHRGAFVPPCPGGRSWPGRSPGTAHRAGFEPQPGLGTMGRFRRTKGPRAGSTGTSLGTSCALARRGRRPRQSRGGVPTGSREGSDPLRSTSQCPFPARVPPTHARVPPLALTPTVGDAGYPGRSTGGRCSSEQATLGRVVVLRDPLADPDDVLRASRSRQKSYSFDVAFDATATQETVYRATTQSLIRVVISGSNATVFAYGPTGCGKTYTMLGTDGEPGLCARTLGELFQAIEDASGDVEYEVSMSYLEIYNEMIRDLLNPSLGRLQLREDAGGTVQVTSITQIPATSADEVMQLLARGNRQRTQEPTAANRTSSRSHAVLQVTVRRRQRGRGLRHGRLFMIDLAGSERAAQTRNRGQRMKEGAHINRSLLALGNCIKALSHRASSKYINYRDSKLTRLLKDSLGGNSHTVMIAHISPASTAFAESRSTLAYAHRAKSIRTTVRQDPLSVAADLHGEIRHLKGQGDTELGRLGQGKHQDIPYTQAQVRLRGARREPVGARRELAGVHREQVALSHLLLQPQGTALPAQHLLALTPRAQRGQQWSEEERGEPVGPSDSEGDSDTGDKRLEVPEPPNVAVARKSIAVVAQKQDRLWQQKAELSRHFRQSQQHPRRLEEALRPRSISEEQRELLALLRCLHRPELEMPEPRSHTLLEGGLRHPPSVTAQRFDHHRALCARIIRQQQQLIADHRLSVPRPLEELYETYLRELAGDPGDTGTLKGTSLPKILPVRGAETPLEWDSGQARSCDHPTPCHDSLPPLRPTRDRAPGDVEQHQEHHGRGHSAPVLCPGEHPPAPTGAHGGAGWQQGQSGTQERWQGAGEEEGITGWQKEIKAVTVPRGHRLWAGGPQGLPVLQSRSERTVLVGVRAPSTQGPPKVLPGAKPPPQPAASSPPPPGRASTRGAAASPGTVPGPPARTMESPVLSQAGEGPDPVPSQRAEHPSHQPQHPGASPVHPPQCQPWGHGWGRGAASRAGGQLSPCQR
ncbi:kinesin-like protein KIF19 [Strix aluco]|uniref:kinesin-like protein KIF19 n=1 Tax=Strix aluco TaxID=111821 RepID=UPI003DA520B5